MSIDSEFVLPAIPNRSLNSPDETALEGRVLLRTNELTGFTENAVFEQSLHDYEDPTYQASQEFSPAFQAHMRSVLGMIEKRFSKSSRIVEVGAGKGAFVTMLANAGFLDVSGYDATYDGHDPRVHKRFLNEGDHLAADLVVMRHTLEHIYRPHLFLKMLAVVFESNPSCTVYIEVPCFDWIKKHEAYFDITYEHVNYFTLNSLKKLFTKAEVGHLFEEQYIYTFAHLSDISSDFSKAYEEGLWRIERFDELFPSQRIKMEEIEGKLGKDQKVYLWGAGTKGCLFLLHAKRAGMVTHSLPFAVDVNPHKVGKWLPGSGIAVKSPEALFEAAKPGDLVIVANPNYRNEIEICIRAAGLFGVQTVVL